MMDFRGINHAAAITGINYRISPNYNKAKSNTNVCFLMGFWEIQIVYKGDASSSLTGPLETGRE